MNDELITANEINENCLIDLKKIEFKYWILLKFLERKIKLLEDFDEESSINENDNEDKEINENKDKKINENKDK